MAWLGGGTPLPIDGTNQIVVRGPYAYIRNPMVIAGLGQGTAVGILVGSWLVLLYVFVGGVLWNVIARPLEEQELHQKFGASYQRYCADVKCWFPRLAPVAGEIVRQQNTDE